jgi:hypothetical protein
MTFSNRNQACVGSTIATDTAQVSPLQFAQIQAARVADH